MHGVGGYVALLPVREQALRNIANGGGGSWCAELEALAVGECIAWAKIHHPSVTFAYG